MDIKSEGKLKGKNHDLRETPNFLKKNNWYLGKNRERFIGLVSSWTRKIWVTICYER
jgi:hypothetical protein